MNIVKNRFKQIDKGKMYGSLVRLCWATILLCLVLKLFGSKQFEMPEYTYNIPDTIQKIVNYIFYCFNSFLFSLVLVKRKLTIKETLIVIGLSTPLFIINLFQNNIVNILKFILEILVYFIIGKVFTKQKWYKILLEVFIVSVLVILYQAITLFYKSINILANNNFVSLLILQIDYYLLLVLTILFIFNKEVYTYEQWKSILVLLPIRRRSKKSIQQVQSNLQKESVEDNSKGFKLFTLMLSVFQFMLVFTLCYFINSTTWQFVVIFVSFCIMRAVFGKSYHANSIITCTTLSCVVFVIATRLSLPPYISTLCNVIIGLLVAYMMYVLYYFNKYTTSQGITISRGMSKEALDEILSNHNLNEIETKILTGYYVKRKSLQYIATSVGYSIDNVKKIKAKIIKRIIG